MPIKTVLTQAMANTAGGRAVPVKVWTDEIEDTAREQLHNVARLPFIHKHVAVMPDVHAGWGSTIGSVIPTRGAVIPAAVGVDIGCGMMAAETTLTAGQLPDNLGPLRSRIERAVPHGFVTIRGRSVKGAWEVAPQSVVTAWRPLQAGFERIEEARPGFAERKNPMKQLGTLGGGNHFIEVCLDTNDRVWVMLHSGSRGIGNLIGQRYIDIAKQDMRRHFINLPDDNLAYFPEGTLHFDEYWEAMQWAQAYAKANRELMMKHVLRVMHGALPPFQMGAMAVNCHHNYAERENHFNANVIVTRKGAVRARLGDYGIIPGSMGARSYIVRGLGCDDAFHSCSHGAGRTMSRTKARSTFSAADLADATAGIECRTDAGVVDEHPGAYKDLDEVMAHQSDLVEVYATLRQVLNVKG